MSAFDDFKELAESLQQDRDHVTNIAHQIFILCSYDQMNQTLDVRQNDISRHQRIRTYSQSRYNQRLMTDMNISVASTVREVPHSGLRLCLLFYGFTDNFTLFSLWTLYRIFILICLL